MNRRDALLAEMGLAPVWKLREEVLAESKSEPAKVLSGPWLRAA